MEKRVIATGLWFFATFLMYELAWSLFGVPRLIGPVLAAAVATFVGLDPLRLFWPGREPRAATRRVPPPEKTPLRSPTKA